MGGGNQRQSATKYQICAGTRPHRGQTQAASLGQVPASGLEAGKTGSARGPHSAPGESAAPPPSPSGRARPLRPDGRGLPTKSRRRGTGTRDRPPRRPARPLALVTTN